MPNRTTLDPTPSRQKHHRENDKTAIDQSFRCAFKNQDWREVKKRMR